MTPHEKAIEAAAKAVCAGSGQAWREPPFNHLHTEALNNHWRHKAEAAISAYLSSIGGANPVIAELAEMYLDHCDEAHRALQFGGYVPLEDDFLVEIPLRLLRIASEIHTPIEAGNGDGWLPINLADRTITDVQDFSEVGITLRMSDRYWVRDDDGRVYEAAWSEDNNGRDFWWDFEGESPVDPVEFMPHPLDKRFSPPPTVSSRDGRGE